MISPVKSAIKKSSPTNANGKNPPKTRWSGVVNIAGPIPSSVSVSAPGVVAWTHCGHGGSFDRLWEMYDSSPS